MHRTPAEPHNPEPPHCDPTHCEPPFAGPRLVEPRLSALLQGRPEGASAEQAKHLRRALRHLSQPGASLADDPIDESRTVMIAMRARLSTVQGTLPRPMVAGWTRQGLLEPAPGAALRLVLSQPGMMLARRLEAGDENGFLAQHREEADVVMPGQAGATVRINEAESPLAWLRRRRNRDGSPMLDEVRFVAGERLRADLTRARMLPRVTANWDAAVASTARGGLVNDPADSTLAARQRARRALDAVGPDLSGILLDVCGFLKGLADIERERRWPARAAKVVLDIALGRLAAHYGLAAEARGRDSAPIAAWQADNARPAGLAIYSSDAAS